MIACTPANMLAQNHINRQLHPFRSYRIFGVEPPGSTCIHDLGLSMELRQHIFPGNHKLRIWMRLVARAAGSWFLRRVRGHRTVFTLPLRDAAYEKGNVVRTTTAHPPCTTSATTRACTIQNMNVLVTKVLQRPPAARSTTGSKRISQPRY